MKNKYAMPLANLDATGEEKIQNPHDKHEWGIQKCGQKTELQAARSQNQDLSLHRASPPIPKARLLSQRGVAAQTQRSSQPNGLKPPYISHILRI